MRYNPFFSTAFSLALMGVFAVACSDDDESDSPARASSGDLAIDIERCSADDADTIASAMDVEVVQHGTSAGTRHGSYVSFSHNTCRIETADGTRYRVSVADADDEPMDGWEAMREDVPPAPDMEGGAEWAQGSGLAEIVDELVTRDGEGLVAVIGDDGYYFTIDPASGDDEASDEELEALAGAAAAVLAEHPTDPHEYCRGVEDAAGEHFGEVSRSRGPSMGGSRLDGERIEFRGCRARFEDDAELTAELGDRDLFTARAEAVDTSRPLPVEGLAVEALALNRDIFVPVGDDLLHFAGSGSEFEDADDLVPFVNAVLSD